MVWQIYPILYTNNLWFQANICCLKFMWLQLDTQVSRCSLRLYCMLLLHSQKTWLNSCLNHFISYWIPFVFYYILVKIWIWTERKRSETKIMLWAFFCCVFAGIYSFKRRLSKVFMPQNTFLCDGIVCYTDWRWIVLVWFEMVLKLTLCFSFINNFFSPDGEK